MAHRADDTSRRRDCDVATGNSFEYPRKESTFRTSDIRGLVDAEHGMYGTGLRPLVDKGLRWRGNWFRLEDRGKAKSGIRERCGSAPISRCPDRQR